MKPNEIEAQSFAIIDAEAGAHGLPAAHWPIVRRMVHTSADFEYIRTVRIHPRAVEAGMAAMAQGKRIITDTNMARVGIRKDLLKPYGAEVTCHMTAARVSRRAQREGITRAKAAVDLAVTEMNGGIYVIGNAPTALLRLLEHVADGSARPALIVGLPVGFVNAAESKEALLDGTVPYITNVGRKGGSNVAAAVVNALALMAIEQYPPIGNA